MPLEDSSGSAALTLKLSPGEAVVLSGCARVAVTRGSLFVHGHVIQPGGQAVLRSCAELGSLLVLEAPPKGPAVRATLTSLERARDAPPPPSETLPGPYRVPKQSARGFEVAPAAGEGTVFPPPWRSACEALGAAAGRGECVVAVVCGPKGAGKSTLARLMVNTLLQHVRQVAFLDVDPGQSELTAPGLLSLSHLTAPLLGPPALRLGCSDSPEPVEQRFIGDVSPSGDPAAYTGAVDSLLTSWREAAPRVPVLVVNTMGWVRGLGLELLCSLLRGCQPTHVLSLGADQQQDRGVPPGAFWTLPGETQPPCEVIQLGAASAQPLVAAPGPLLHDPGLMLDEDAIDGAAPDAPAQPALGQARQKTGADLRGLLWAAWCHRATTSRGSSALADTIWADAWAPRTGGGAPASTVVAEALTRAAPYCVRASSFRLVALLTHFEGGEAFHALNGAVAGLGVHDTHSTVPRCLGLALVRSVDPAAGVLFLLTPVPVALAATADALLLGKLELPLALLLSPPHSCPYVALGALSGAEATGASAMRSRNNLLRRGAAAGP